MSTEEGTITKAAGNKAWVLVARSEMCDCCGSKGICHTLGGGKNMEAEALNTAGAKVGDRVRIKIKTGTLWKISLLFYMIPVIALVLGALVGIKIGTRIHADPELFSALSAIVFAGLSFAIIKLIANRLQDKKDYIPEVERILSQG